MIKIIKIRLKNFLTKNQKSILADTLVVFVGLFGSGVDCFDDNDARIMKTKDKSQGIKNFHIMSN